MQESMIDDKFIETWIPKFDEIERDEEKYNDVLQSIKTDISKIGTISKNTLEKIYNWKAARAKGWVEWGNYRKYEEDFKKVLQANECQKLVILDGLPGIGIPVASTILHFMYPETFPIVDVRTVEMLQSAGYLDQSKSLGYFRNTMPGYKIFRSTIKNLAQSLQRWSLRQIDKALFAYHKVELKPKNKNVKRQMTNNNVICKVPKFHVSLERGVTLMESIDDFVERLSKAVGCYYKTISSGYSLKRYDSNVHGSMGVFGWVCEKGDFFEVSTYKHLGDKAKLTNYDNAKPNFAYGKEGLIYLCKRRSEGEDYQKTVNALKAVLAFK